jgi:glycerophosphoryl diester phosphodiesterase
VELPENTIPSFKRAIEVGADALETDCHLTQDGVVVVSHDETAERMANVQRAIRDSTLAEVQTWDVGWGFVDRFGDRPFERRGFRIPTLTELLEAVPRVRINVDAKVRGMVRPLLDTLRRAKAEQRVLIASFDIATLREVRRAGYPGKTGFARREVLTLLALPQRVLKWRRPQGSTAQLPHRVGPLDLGTPHWVDKMHALGLEVHFWTVNEPSRAEELLRAGADAIMTDDPRKLAPLFR